MPQLEYPPLPCPCDRQVTELSVILDSSFFFDVQGSLAPLLQYAKEDPSRAYSPTCAEVELRR